jgi:hypothetical protein
MVLGSVAGAIIPGKRWADVELPIQVDLKPGPAPPPPRTKWNIDAGPFVVTDDRWSTGYQAALSVRRSSSRHVESGVAIFCDLWRPAKEAPEGSPFTWKTSGRTWLIGAAETNRFWTAEPRKGTPRLFLDATAGAYGVASNATMLQYDAAVYSHYPKVIKLMEASVGMRADAGIGVSFPMGGCEPEIAIKLHGVIGKAETTSTFMLELGVGF